MAKNTIAYKDWLGAKLSDQKRAARYLSTALEDSPGAFLKALRKVSDSREKKQLAESAGVSRESLYRMMSETGNPTIGSLDGILRALGFRLKVEPVKPGICEDESVTLSVHPIPVVKHQVSPEVVEAGSDTNARIAEVLASLGSVNPFISLPYADISQAAASVLGSYRRSIETVFSPSVLAALQTELPFTEGLGEIAKKIATSWEPLLEFSLADYSYCADAIRVSSIPIQAEKGAKGIHLVPSTPKTKGAIESQNPSHEPRLQLLRKPA